MSANDELTRNARIRSHRCSGHVTPAPPEPTCLEGTEVTWLIKQAVRAPSVHNTQPWRFRWDGRAFDIVADLRRGLVASDPEGRELVISCGAALFNLRLALRQLGRVGIVTEFPDPADPRVLARVAIERGPVVSDGERRLLAALPKRHTHRGSFAEHTISAGLAVRLQQAAESQGSLLVYVHDPGSRRRILDLARAAQRQNSTDGAVRSETADWTRAAGTAHRDGVPARAYSAGPEPAGTDQLSGRDFDLGRNIGTAEAAEPSTAALAVLMTEQDLAPDWLQAGLALECVVLTAANEWSFAAVHSQVMEVPPLRAELRRELRTAWHPQLMLEFGYAPTSASTPRRPPEDVLDLVDAADSRPPYSG